MVGWDPDTGSRFGELAAALDFFSEPLMVMPMLNRHGERKGRKEEKGKEGSQCE